MSAGSPVVLRLTPSSYDINVSTVVDTIVSASGLIIENNGAGLAITALEFIGCYTIFSTKKVHTLPNSGSPSSSTFFYVFLTFFYIALPIGFLPFTFFQRKRSFFQDVYDSEETNQWTGGAHQALTLRCFQRRPTTKKEESSSKNGKTARVGLLLESGGLQVHIDTTSLFTLRPMVDHFQVSRIQ